MRRMPSRAAMGDDDADDDDGDDGTDDDELQPIGEHGGVRSHYGSGPAAAARRRTGAARSAGSRRKR